MWLFLRTISYMLRSCSQLISCFCFRFVLMRRRWLNQCDFEKSFVHGRLLSSNRLFCRFLQLIFTFEKNVRFHNFHLKLSTRLGISWTISSIMDLISLLFCEIWLSISYLQTLFNIQTYWKIPILVTRFSVHLAELFISWPTEICCIPSDHG